MKAFATFLLGPLSPTVVPHNDFNGYHDDLNEHDKLVQQP
jgi:hypothetical protein